MFKLQCFEVLTDFSQTVYSRIFLLQFSLGMPFLGRITATILRILTTIPYNLDVLAGFGCVYVNLWS